MLWMHRTIRLATAFVLISTGGCGLGGMYPGISPFRSNRTAAMHSAVGRDAGSSKGVSGITSKPLPPEASETSKPPDTAKSASIPSTPSLISTDKKTSEEPSGVRVVRLPEQPKLPRCVAENAPVAELLAELTAEREAKSTGKPDVPDAVSSEKSVSAEDAKTPSGVVPEEIPEKTADEKKNETGKTKTEGETSPDAEEKTIGSEKSPVKTMELTGEMITRSASPTVFAIPLATLPLTDAGEWDSVTESDGSVHGGDVRADADTRLVDDRLSVRNLALVRQVKGFGQKVAFEQSFFTASQAVIVYAEIERFESLRSSNGYYTAMRGTMVLRDMSGRIVMRVTPGLAEETCDSLRRDYYITHVLRLPTALTPGRYSLEFTVEDTCSGRTGTATMTLRVE